MKKRIGLGLCSIILMLTTVSATASALFHIEPIISVPNMIVTGKMGIAVYKISTQLPGPNGILNLPHGVSQYHDDQPQDCGMPAFTLTPSTYCLLHLKIDATDPNSGAMIAGTPLIDNHPELPISLYTPLPNGINAQIVPANQPGLPTLEGPTETVILHRDTTITLPIKNVSSSIAVNNLNLSLPASILSHVKNITHCDSVNANETCDISFTVDADAPQTSVETAVAQGANTPPYAITVQMVVPPPPPPPPNPTISLTPADHQHLQYQAIIVKNISQNNLSLVDMIETLDDNSNIEICSANDPVCLDACTLGSNLGAGQSCHLWLHSKDPAVNTSAALGSHTEPVTVTVTPSVGDVTTAHFNLTYQLSLYIGGFFTKNAASDTTYNHIALWDGAHLSSLGTGLGENGDTLNNAVYALTLYQGDLYAGGAFGSPLNNIARWDTLTQTWKGLVPNGNNNTNAGLNGSVNAFATHKNHLYVGGSFLTDMNATPLNYMTEWDGSHWQTLAHNGEIGLNQPVYALLLDRTDLYAGGPFTATANNTLALQHIARWSLPHGTWNHLQQTGQPAPGVYGDTVRTLSLIGNILYLGGSFSHVGCVSPLPTTQAANNIVGWDVSTDTWQSVAIVSGSGLDDSVYALAAQDNNLYAGGLFADTHDDKVELNLIGLLNNNQWSGLLENAKPGLMVSSVNTLVAQGDQLYVGGDFTQSTDSATKLNYIAIWDGHAWHPIPSGNNKVGFNSTIQSLLIASSIHW